MGHVAAESCYLAVVSKALISTLPRGTRIRIRGVERIIEDKMDDVVVCATTERATFYTYWSSEVAEVLPPKEPR